MNADYQLRHATVSRHGSFWALQTDANTKDMLRELSRAASLPSRLQHIDAGAAYALDAQRMLKEDVVIDFMDGQFAVSGADLSAFTPVEVAPGSYVMVRSNTATGDTSSGVLPHSLSTITPEELDNLTVDVPELTAPGIWFLIPKPPTINPIVLATKKPGVNLSYGIDFFTSANFIITQLPPAEYFDNGGILATVAEVSFESFDSFVSDSPRSKKGRKWVTTFARRAQSVELFRRAAAEFCGLLVLQDDDVLLNAVKLPDDTVIYAFASAGVVHVDYAHTPLELGTAYPAGYVVCDRFEMRSRVTHGQNFLTSSGYPVSLRGVFGIDVQLPADGIVAASYEYVDANDSPHVKLHYGGGADKLALLWANQMAQEKRTGQMFSDAVGWTTSTFSNPATFPPTIDMSVRIRNFYRNRLQLLVVEGLPDAYRFELHRFMAQHSPVGTIVLLADSGAAIMTPSEAAPPPVNRAEYPTPVTSYSYDTEVLSNTN